MLNAHDLYVDALSESVNVLNGQQNYVQLLREPIKTIYSYNPNLNQTNATWTVDEPLRILNRTEKCIREKISALMRQTTKDVTLSKFACNHCVMH